MTNKTKVFELGAEGGSLTVYQFLDDKNNDWYFHNVRDMGFEEEAISLAPQSLLHLKNSKKNNYF